MRLSQSIILVLLLSLAAFGQTNKGGISGTVADPSGASIPGAKVTITNVGTKQSVTITATDDGVFSANLLDPVVYTIEVEAANFKTTVLSDVKVDTATTRTVSVVMQAGSISETVNVTAEAPLLNADSGTVGQTITERQLQDVPLSNRSVLDLALTAPNVTGDAGSEDPAVTSGAPVPGFNLSLNGGRPGSTSILADGANNTGVGIARAVVSFTPETVQEFTIQTSGFSAEYGQTGGGVINLTTKSGTNRITGTALWYTRNPATNARTWGNGTLRPKNNLRYNQLSFTVGGPVFLPRIGEGGPELYNGKNKTFFFVAAEPRYRRDFVVTDTLLPTDAMRAGDFTGITRLVNGWAPTSIVNQFLAQTPTFANQITVGGNPNIYQQFTLSNGRLIPIALGTGFQYCQFNDPRRTLNAAGQPQCTTAVNALPNPALNVIPQAFINGTAVKGYGFLPNAGGYFLNGNGQLANYVVNRFVQQDETRYTARVDHQLTKSDKLNFRFSYVPSVGAKGFGSDVNGSSGTYSQARQMVVGYNRIFSPNIINDLQFNYTRGRFSDDFGPQYSVDGGTNVASQLGLPSLTNGGLPLFSLSNDGPNAFASIGSSGSTNNTNTEKQYGLTDTVTWIRGNMTWKMGVQLNHQLLNVTPFFGASGGSWQFRVLNTSSNRSISTANGGNTFASYLLGVPNNVLTRPSLLNYEYIWNNGAAFIQNDWKIRPNLTVNLGLRYSLQMPREEKNNQQGVFRPDLAQTVQFPSVLPAATQTALNNIRAATGINITSAQVVPFAFSGQGGRSRYLYDPEYTDFEPRFGFAYSPKLPFRLTEGKTLVVRGGYGISHPPLTGNNRLPSPDFGATVNPGTIVTGSTGTADLTQPISFYNPPTTSGQSLNTVLGTDSNGLVYLNSLGVPGATLADPSGKVKYPYVQNWNLTLSYEVLRNTVVEVAYVGSKGTHLFLPSINANPRDFNAVNAVEANLPAINLDTTTFPDPLGRRDLSGNVIAVPYGSLLSQYAGVNILNTYYNAAGNSIRHGMYISLNRRVSKGLTFTANYTYGKSLDDASDASPDKNVLTSGFTQGANSTFGAARSTDRAISAYDIKNAFSSTFIYDLPVGHGRQFFSKVWSPIDAAIGGWTMSGVFRLQGGFPYLPAIPDGNGLNGTLTHTIRPDIVAGVPLINPLFNKNCLASTVCEPYINPAAFERPSKGTLGNAARTLDIRGPIQKYFDVSFQKNFKFPFKLDDEGKRRFQFRVDLINAFNLPNFRTNSGNLSSATDFVGAPVETPITLAEYNNWATANGRPAATGITDPSLLAVQALTTSSQLTSGALPVDFFHVQLPQGFATAPATTYNITTLSGLKLYRLRNAYNTGFGQLRELGLPRYIQFGLKIYF